MSDLAWQLSISAGSGVIGAIVGGGVTLLGQRWSASDERQRWSRENDERNRTRFHDSRLATYSEFLATANAAVNEMIEAAKRYVLVTDTSAAPTHFTAPGLALIAALDAQFHGVSVLADRVRLLTTSDAVHKAADDLQTAVGNERDWLMVTAYSDPPSDMPNTSPARAAFTKAANAELRA